MCKDWRIYYEYETNEYETNEYETNEYEEKK